MTAGIVARGRAVGLTVSMPARDACRDIGHAIESVLSQTGVDLELIVVDDGSTDGTADVVRAIDDRRLRLIVTGGRGGDAACHNLAMRESTAEFIAHLSPHDRVMPGALRAMVNAAQRAPGVGLVHGYSVDVDEDGHITREAFRAQRRRLLTIRRPDVDYRRALFTSELVLDPFRLYRRDVLQAVGGLDERCGDAGYDVALKIADRFTIALVPAFVCAHRKRPAGGGVRGRAQSVTRSARRLLQLRRRAGSAVSRIGRRLGDRVYEALGARLTGWRIASIGSARALASLTTRRVAYYTWRFPTLSETFVHREIAALKRAGGSVVILADAAGDLELVDRDGVSLLADTQYVGDADRRVTRRYHRRFLVTRPLRYMRLFVYVVSRRYGPLKTLGEDLTLFSQCVHVAGVLESRVDHVHAPWADRSAFIVSVAARLLGLTYSVHARAHDVHRTAYRVGLEDRLAHAEFVVTNTRYNVEHLRSLVPSLRESRLILVYNGIEPARFVPGAGRSNGPPRLLCVARLIEQKGLDDLLRACRILERLGHEFVCDVIGGAETPLYTNYFVRLMQLHRTLGLGERVRFLGARPLAEVMERYRQADVFVLPCIVAADGSRDITPNALIEAMAMKLAVVSTTVTGVPEIVEHGVSGLLVPPADPDALADAIGRLLRDPELRRTLSEHARTRIEQRFDIDKNIASYVRLFRGAVGSAGT